MMTPEQFEKYVERLHLSEAGREYLLLARNGKDGKPAAPARPVDGWVGNMNVRYPSGKNEKVLPLESKRLEFAITLIMENDDAYLEFLSQPPTVDMEYRGAKGRRIPCHSTFDFIALRSKEIQLIEAKPADRMRELVKDYPGRFQQVDESHWTSAPAEEVAKAFGFTFLIWTDAEFTRERIRNLKYWDPFLKLGRSHVPESEWRPVQEFLLKHPGISVDELGEASGVRGQFVVRWMLAHRLIYFDLDKFILANPERTRIYPSASVAKSMEALRIPEPTWSSVVGNVMTTPPPILQELTAALMKYGTKAFDRIYWKWRVITGQVPRAEWDVWDRTVRRWRCAFEKGGYMALRDGRPGNTKQRIAPALYKLAHDLIDQLCAKPPKKKKGFLYSAFRSKCVELKIPRKKIPSHVWFRAIYNSKDQVKLTLAQEGARAVYPLLFNRKALEGLWDSRGDYPFMDVHCDHTELSIFVSSERTGQVLNKVWFTVLFDATCRAVLAIYLSLDKPSRDSLMMVLRDCIQRHKRWPFGMIVDHGSEFKSTYFETLTGAIGIRVEKRPKRHPKYGNPVENFFGVTEGQFIQILEGCSAILKTPRIATKAVDPQRDAPWTLSELFKATEYYCFKIFNETEHRDLGKTPAKALEDLCRKHGIDKFDPVKFDNDLLIQTMPEVEGGTRRVFKPCCVKVRGEWFFNLRLAPFINRNLPTRWDPGDPSRVLVELPEGWVECQSKYVKEVEGLSVRDVQFFAQELRARDAATMRNRWDSDVVRGNFFRELKETVEPALRKRLEEARENQKVNAKLTKISPSPSAPSPPEDTKPTSPAKSPSLPPSPKPGIRIKAPEIL